MVWIVVNNFNASSFERSEWLMKLVASSKFPRLHLAIEVASEVHTSAHIIRIVSSRNRRLAAAHDCEE
jgi:hypothetical protein